MPSSRKGWWQTLELERLLSSYGRTKILTVMLDTEELNITEITRRSGLSHTVAAGHLEFLKKSGILTEKRFNRIRIFRVDRTSPLTAALSRFYTEWKEADASLYAQGYN